MSSVGMKVVYKYKLSQSVDVDEIDLPRNSEILHLGEGKEDGALYLWALVDPKRTMAKRRFRIAGTGHYLTEEETTKFLGTVQMSNGIVWHIWEF